MERERVERIAGCRRHCDQTVRKPASFSVTVQAMTAADLSNQGLSETSDLNHALPNFQVTSPYGLQQPNSIESAGVTLVKGDLAGIARARLLSHATMRNIRQDLVLAFVYNLLGIPIAAGVLYRAFGLLLSPIVAAAAMNLSSVPVIGNALRLRFAIVEWASAGGAEPTPYLSSTGASTPSTVPFSLHTSMR